MIRITTCLVLCLGIAGCAATPPAPETPTFPTASIERKGKPPLLIEDDGSQARHKLYLLAQQVRQMDTEIHQWQQSTSADAAIKQSMIDTMQQNRDVAIAELEQGWQATSTRSRTALPAA